MDPYCNYCRLSTLYPGVFISFTPVSYRHGEYHFNLMKTTLNTLYNKKKSSCFSETCNSKREYNAVNNPLKNYHFSQF